MVAQKANYLPDRIIAEVVVVSAPERRAHGKEIKRGERIRVTVLPQELTDSRVVTRIGGVEKKDFGSFTIETNHVRKHRVELRLEKGGGGLRGPLDTGVGVGVGVRTGAERDREAHVRRFGLDLQVFEQADQIGVIWFVEHHEPEVDRGEAILRIRVGVGVPSKGIARLKEGERDTCFRQGVCAAQPCDSAANDCNIGHMRGGRWDEG